MNAAPCITARPAYTPLKRLENANQSGPAHRHRAFFMPVFSQSPTGMLAGCNDRKALRCSLVQFSRPASVPDPVGFSC